MNAYLETDLMESKDQQIDDSELASNVWTSLSLSLSLFVTEREREILQTLLIFFNAVDWLNRGKKGIKNKRQTYFDAPCTAAEEGSFFDNAV